MPALTDLLSLIDSLKRRGASTVRDVAANPRDGMRSLLDTGNANARDFDRRMTGLLGDYLSVVPQVSEQGLEGMVSDIGMLGPMAGTFAGVGAKTANMGLLTKAQELAKKGADPAEVWKTTGWTDQFPDKKWRFEIPDNAAKERPYPFNPKQALEEAKTRAFIEGDPQMIANVKAMEPYAKKTQRDLEREYRRTGKQIVDSLLSGNKEQAYALSDSRHGLTNLLGEMHRRSFGPASAYIKHPELKAAYPDVGTLHLRTNAEDLGANTRGAYLEPMAGRGEQIAVSAGGPDKSTFLHEAQHAIQRREGFARGGNPQSASKLPERKALIDKLETELNAAIESRDKAKFDVVRRAINELESESGMGAYKRLAGEAEARLTQSRMNLTPAERAARPPWLEFDVPREQQIVHGLLDSGAYR